VANLISQRIQKWSAVESGDIDFNAIHALIEFLSSQRYAEYGPTLGNYPEFRDRLTAWLSSANSETDQKLMYREFPRLCRGGSSSLTFPGVHPETLRGEPPSTHQGETGWTSMKA
jgi:hypothetical protein